MSIFDLKKVSKEYLREVKKQTDPYGYFCKKEQIKRGEQRNSSCPPFCIVDNLHNLIFEDEEKEGAFETDKRYLFIKDNDCNYETDEIVSELILAEEADILYWDEDKLLLDKRHTPFFKQDWSPDSFLFCNYIGNSYLISTEIAMRIIDNIRSDWCERELRGINENAIAYEDPYEMRSEDELRYEFLLRASELTNKIIHIPKVLCHRPLETGDVEEIYTDFMLTNQSNGYKRIRNEALKRRNSYIYIDGINQKKNNIVINNSAINNNVIHNSVINKESGFSVPGISVIIPSRDHSDVLFNCLKGIKACVDGNEGRDRLEIIVVDNGSNQTEKNRIEEYLDNMRNEYQVQYIYEPMEFNFSAMCNLGAKRAGNELLLFLNDDIEPIMCDSFEKLAAFASLEHIGAVGCKLYYPNGNVLQHDGVVCDLDCGPTHKLATFSDENVYYYGLNVFNRNVLAVTGACLMVSAEKYFKVGGFSDKMGVGYNDIDLCVKLHENGYYNMLLNECVMYHHESLSRGMDHVEDAKYVRLKKERAILYENHPWIREKGDPFYSPNLISDTLEYKVNVLADYEKRNLRNKRIFDTSIDKKIIKLFSEEGSVNDKKLHFNVENTGFARGIMLEDEDYFVLEGWALVSGKDNSFYNTYLCLKDEDEFMIFDTFKINREDVAIVFANERNNCLAGFTCKIPVSMIDKDKKYRLAIIKKSAITGRKYGIIGGYYESGRGYYTEEV